jgi:hypothetical protein
VNKRTLFAIGAMLIPILAFYVILARETVNIPFLDDYGGVLGFVSGWSQLGTVHEKIMDILTAQHSEYKLMFANALYALQYMISGRINFAVLSIIGNCLLLPLYVVLYRMWMADHREISGRLILFVPVSWVLFQLQYYSLLNWPMSSLQHIAVILFSLVTIYLLSRDTQHYFHLSLLTLALAVGSSGNGFFVIPIGCLILIQFRRLDRLAYWLATSVAILALYLYKYNFLSSTAHADHSIVSSLHHISMLYALSFLGASIARYGAYIPAAILGACMCAVFVYAIFDKLYIRSTAIFYSILFILVTSVAVSGLRSDLGIAQGLVSRYRIYSNLMLVFLYLYGIGKVSRADKAPERNRSVPIRPAALAAILIVAIGFNIGSNYAGFKLLHTRTELTKDGLARWEHGEESITTAPGPANEDPVIQRQRLHGNYAPEDTYLRQAILLHLYSPPLYSQKTP